MFKFTGLVMEVRPDRDRCRDRADRWPQRSWRLINLGKLILTLYAALVVFMLCVLCR